MANPEPRLGFARPGAVTDAAGARTLIPLRPARGASPVVAEWRRRFPVGVFVDNGVPDTAAETRAMLHDPVNGLKAIGLTDICYTNTQPYSHEQVQGLVGLIGSEIAGGEVSVVVAPFGRTHPTDPNTGLYSVEWYLTAYSPSFHTDAAADVLADRILDPPFDYDIKPALIGYNLRDDTTHVGSISTMVRTMTRAFQRRDTFGRAVTAVLGTESAIAEVAVDTDVALFSLYPCGEYANGDDTAEGDFHRSTYSTVPDLGGGGGDWVDKIRSFVDDAPEGLRFWLALQNHQTTGGTVGTLLRYPTAREMRAQVWIAVGEGATGLYWFTWNDKSDNEWEGLQNENRADLRTVASELSHRLTPAIRARLLTARRVTDAFTATGGGSTGYPVNYPNAYVSTLYDADAGVSYCVVCNHSTSTANVTINSGSLAGYLVNLETGDRLNLGGTVSLPALDGTIYRLDPQIGVPRWREATQDEGVEAFWSDHWANPASANYVSPANIVTHARVVDVTGVESLTAAVAANPGDNVTFRLGAGYVQPTGETVTIYRRNGIHFIAADPNNRPIVRRFEVYGSVHADQYNGSTTPKAGFVHKLNTFGHASHDQAAYDFFTPSRDVIFRDLDFRGDGQLIDYDWYFIDSSWQHDHRVTGAPIFVRCVRDVLIENCHFERYVWGSATAQPPPELEPNDTDPPNTRHDGFIHGNSGVENVVVRSCTFRVTDHDGVVDTTRGFPYGIFFDGPRGVVIASCDLTVGRYFSGLILFLDNNDFTGDFDGSGQIRMEYERNAKFCVIYDCDLKEGGNGPIQWTGRDCLVVGNRINLPSPGFTLSRVCQISPRCSRLWTRGHIYYHYGNVIDSNDVPQGNVTAFVEYISGDADNCIGSGFGEHHWGHIGRSTVKNNSVTGTVTAWIRDKPGEDVASDGGDTVSGNTSG